MDFCALVVSSAVRKCVFPVMVTSPLTHSLNTSLPTSSKDEDSDFPTLGFLLFIASCFTLQCV